MKLPASLVDTGLFESDVPLGPLTTYKSGGPARYYFKPSGLDQLREVLSSVEPEDLPPILVLGRGSNLLVSDSGYDGLVIHIGPDFSQIEVEGLDVSAGAGASLPVLARQSVKAGVAGLEFFVGVPGSVGGAVRQNAGCFGVETKDRLVNAVILDASRGEIIECTAADLDMSYRHSSVRSEWVVVSATFQGTSHDTSGSEDELREITRWRKENQPGGTLNAGSVFKNPPGDTAGRLIEASGLKGHSAGNVSVSTKHANFFVAEKGASSDDVRRLVLEVASLVEERTGTLLQPEIQMVGFDDDD